MPVQTEEQVVPEELTEEELEAEDERKAQRFGRCCLAAAVCMVLLGVDFVLAEQAGIGIGYLLPPYSLTLGCLTASCLLLMVTLFAVRKNTLAMLIMIISVWMGIFTWGICRVQEPATVVTKLPGMDKTMVFTLVSTPGSAVMRIDEPILGGVLSRHWKIPVHAKNLPFDEQISLMWNEAGQEVQLYFNDKLWSVYRAETGQWAAVVVDP